MLGQQGAAWSSSAALDEGADDERGDDRRDPDVARSRRCPAARRPPHSLTSPAVQGDQRRESLCDRRGRSDPCCRASRSHSGPRPAPRQLRRRTAAPNRLGQGRGADRHQQWHRRERLARVADRAVPAPGRGELIARLAQLRPEALAARRPGLHPVKQRPGGRAGPEIHARGVEQRGLQPSLDRSRRASADALASRSTRGPELAAERQRLGQRQRDLAAPRPVRGARQRLARGDRPHGTGSCMVSSWPSRTGRRPARRPRRFCQRPVQAQHRHVSLRRACGHRPPPARSLPTTQCPRRGRTPAGGPYLLPGAPSASSSRAAPRLPALPHRTKQVLVDGRPRTSGCTEPHRSGHPR